MCIPIWAYFPSVRQRSVSSGINAIAPGRWPNGVDIDDINGDAEGDAEAREEPRNESEGKEAEDAAPDEVDGEGVETKRPLVSEWNLFDLPKVKVHKTCS